MKTPGIQIILGAILLCGSAIAGPRRPIVRCKAELDRAVLPAGKQQKAVVKITLEADEAPTEEECPPINLCIVLDRSGSMQGEKIRHARMAALEAIERLNKGDTFSLITYNNVVETVIPAGPIQNRRKIEKLIENIDANGNTALFGGVSEGANELRKALEDGPKDMVHRLLLLSDGKANVGPDSPEELGRLGSSLVKEGITVTTIGIGSGYNEDLMTQLAERSDGNTYFVAESQELASIMNNELGDALNVVAREVKIIIECSGDVRPIRTIGREARIRGQQVELSLNQLYGGQERYLLLEVDVPPGSDKAELELLDARVEYENILNATNEQQDTRLLAKFSPSEKVVMANVNPVVQRDVYLNYGAEAKDEAIRLYESGKKDEAVELLRFNGRQLQQASEDYQILELNEEAGNLFDQGFRLENEGLTTTNRKELRTESSQERSQQKLKFRSRKTSSF